MRVPIFSEKGSILGRSLGEDFTRKPGKVTNGNQYPRQEVCIFFPELGCSDNEEQAYIGNPS